MRHAAAGVSTLLLSSVTEVRAPMIKKLGFDKRLWGAQALREALCLQQQKEIPSTNLKI